MAMTQRAVPDSPPIDFAVYGLSASWPAFRWFEFFDGELGRPTHGVRLGHQAADRVDSPYLSVATLPRERFDQVCVAPRPDRDRRAELAEYAAFQLISLTFPGPDVPQVAGMTPLLVAHSERAAADNDQWPATTWAVDGQPVQVATWRFAGGWAAFCDDLPDVYLTAAGCGMEPTGLELGVVEDGAPYGIDLTAPLTINALSLARQTVGPSSHSSPNDAGYHPDQLALTRD